MDSQTQFVDNYLPAIENRCRHRYRSKDYHTGQELTQEVRSHAWRMFLTARRKGKIKPLAKIRTDRKGQLTPWSLARYATMRVEEGRRFCGQHGRDVMNANSTRTRILHLDDNQDLADSLEDHRADPYRCAQQALDYQDFLSRLEPLEQQVIRLLAKGFSVVEIAREVKTTVRRARRIVKHNLADKLIDFFGPAIVPV